MLIYTARGGGVKRCRLECLLLLLLCPRVTGAKRMSCCVGLRREEGKNKGQSLLGLRQYQVTMIRWLEQTKSTEIGPMDGREGGLLANVCVHFIYTDERLGAKDTDGASLDWQ